MSVVVCSCLIAVGTRDRRPVGRSLLVVVLGCAAIYLLLPRPRPYPALAGASLGTLALIAGGHPDCPHRQRLPSKACSSTPSPAIAIVAGDAAGQPAQPGPGRPVVHPGHAQHLRPVPAAGGSVSDGGDHHHLRRGDHRHVPVRAHAGPAERAVQRRRAARANRCSRPSPASLLLGALLYVLQIAATRRKRSMNFCSGSRDARRRPARPRSWRLSARTRNCSRQFEAELDKRRLNDFRSQTGDARAEVEQGRSGRR